MGSFSLVRCQPTYWRRAITPSPLYDHCFLREDTMAGLLTHDEMLLSISSPCNPSFFFSLKDGLASFLGTDSFDDLSHDGSTFSVAKEVACTVKGAKASGGLSYADQGCPFEVTIYPSRAYVALFFDRTPIFVMFGSVIAFSLLCTFLLVYSRYIHSQQQIIINKASRSEAIVHSLFPDTVRDRLYEDRWDDPMIRSLLSSNDTSAQNDKEAPIADLFPCCTVVRRCCIATLVAQICLFS